MDMITQHDIQRLAETPQGWCVSLFLPTHRAGVETQQDPLRLKNMLREAEERLLAYGLRSTEAKDLLDPLQALINDSLFWQYQSDGLALFRAPDVFYSYRLPISFEAVVLVNKRFHLKPLLPLLSGDGLFYILALSQNTIRLLQATRYQVSEVALPEVVPESLAEVLKYDGPEKQLQFHTGTPAIGRGRRAAIFHGHGVGTDDSKEHIQRYLRQIDRGLQEVLREERVPLVLAGVEYLLALYRKVNTYARLLDQGVAGNPEELSAAALHERAWVIAEPFFLKAQQDAAAQYRHLAHTEHLSHLASNDVREVVPAAFHGRVAFLFVARMMQTWGTFDADTQVVSAHREMEADDDDLLDFAAIHTLLKGGSVYVVEPEQVPDQTPLAAVFRY